VISYELNQTIPFMQWHWGNHTAHTVGLTREQRGFLDEVRIALWSVAGVKMLRADLMERLSSRPDSSDESTLNALIRRGILVQDAEGWVSDQVLSHQYAEALRKGAISRANGSKGGRPTKQRRTVQPNVQGNAQSVSDDAQDF
jgi:hypothetical protein